MSGGPGDPGQSTDDVTMTDQTDLTGHGEQDAATLLHQSNAGSTDTPITPADRARARARFNTPTVTPSIERFRPFNTTPTVAIRQPVFGMHAGPNDARASLRLTPPLVAAEMPLPPTFQFGVSAAASAPAAPATNVVPTSAPAGAPHMQAPLVAAAPLGVPNPQPPLPAAAPPQILQQTADDFDAMMAGDDHAAFPGLQQPQLAQEALAAPPQHQQLYALTMVNGQQVMQPVQVPVQVQAPPAAFSVSSAKMPAPPKFGGVVDKDIVSIELWVRDVQRYAHRVRTPLKEVLTVLTQGNARVNVDNMMRDPITAALPDAAFADKFVNYYQQQVQPRQMQAKEKLFNGLVRMRAGGTLHEYVMEFRSVIMDAAPMLPMDSIFYFKKGLLPELKAECLTDAMGGQFTSVDAIITHAFVQEQKLLCRRTAASAVVTTDAQLNNLQGPYQQGGPPAKRGRHYGNRGGDRNGAPRGGFGGGARRWGEGAPRWGDGGGRGGRGGYGRGGGRPRAYNNSAPRVSSRTDEQQRMFQLARETGKCSGCLSLYMPEGHLWRGCPMNPDNAGMARVAVPVPGGAVPDARG